MDKTATNITQNEPMKRVSIFIDGGNFYRRIRKNNWIPKGTIFDYIKFADFVSRGRTIVSKSYYIGVVSV